MVFCIYINYRQWATPGGGRAKAEVRGPGAIGGPWKDLHYAP